MTDIKNKFNDFLHTNLNQEQLKAVTYKDNAILVIAGAGSGKTRVITARIANLILNHAIQPHQIVALTFTNKAAKEMQERIVHFLKESHVMLNNSTAELPFIGTFHSYCLRLLKKNQELLETPFFSILDDDDQQKILHGIITRNGMQKEMTSKNLAYQISHIKNNSTNQDFIDELYAVNPRLQAIYNAYEHEKKASKCLDFDDLLLETLKLFKKHPSFTEKIHGSVRHILVDEYQDTNVVQHELLKYMALEKNKFAVDSLCVVGDEDQSIYSWRGATIANIINFKKDFPKAISIKIEQNYRSIQPILDIANNVITHNKQRNPKKLWSEKKAHDRIRQFTCLSEYQEGDLIAQYAASASKKQSLSSVAVLYRTHFQSRAIEEALVRNSIPYRIIGGVQFYERKEIRDLLAYLRLIVNPFDRASFFRIINSPNRGLGLKFEELFHTHWHDQAFLTFHDIAQQLIEKGEVTGIKKAALVDFIKVFAQFKPSDKASHVLEKTIHEIGYLSFMKESYDPEEANTRIDNIKELLNAIKHFESGPVNTIQLFLDEVALMQEISHRKNDTKDALLLMTLHGAKGLEFDTVILVGLEEGLLPSSRSMSQQETLEEERRLFYVGITRAKERLLLTHSRYRYAYKNMTDQRPSRFLAEVPEDSLGKEDCSYWKSYEMSTYFSQWLGTTQPKKEAKVLTFGPAQSLKKPSVSTPVTTETKKESSLSSSFKINQPVNHATFGIGLVAEIEVKNPTTTYVTVNFKKGKKRIEAKFLSAV